jgi:hypothetical protein
VGEEEAFVDALEAESVSAGGQGWGNEGFETNWTGQLVTIGFKQSFLDADCKFCIGNSVLLILRSTYAPALDLNFNFPSLLCLF